MDQLGRVYEALRKRSPQSLGDLEVATGISRAAISSLLSRAIDEGQPITRVSRGVYHTTPLQSTFTPNDESAPVAPLTSEISENFSTQENETKSELKGSARRVHKLLGELQSELDSLARELQVNREKARRYDELSVRFRGFSMPGSVD